MDATKSPFLRQYLRTFAKLKLENIIIIHLLPGPLFSLAKTRRETLGLSWVYFLVFIHKMLIFGAVKVSISLSSSPQIMQLFERFTSYTALLSI